MLLMLTGDTDVADVLFFDEGWTLVVCATLRFRFAEHAMDVAFGEKALATWHAATANAARVGPTIEGSIRHGKRLFDFSSTDKTYLGCVPFRF